MKLNNVFFESMDGMTKLKNVLKKQQRRYHNSSYKHMRMELCNLVNRTFD